MDPTWLWHQCVPLWGSCASPPISGPVAGAGRVSGVLVEHPRGKSTAVCGTRYGTALVAPSVRSSSSLPENIPGRLARGQRRGEGKRAFYGSVSALE